MTNRTGPDTSLYARGLGCLVKETPAPVAPQLNCVNRHYRNESHSPAVGTGDRLSPTFRPSHDGTASQPIVFFAPISRRHRDESRQWVRLRRTGAADSPLIDAGGDGAYRSHIVIDGFYFISVGRRR